MGGGRGRGVAGVRVAWPVPGLRAGRHGRGLGADLAATARAARKSGEAAIGCSSSSIGASFSETGASSPAARRAGGPAVVVRAAAAGGRDPVRRGPGGAGPRLLQPGAGRRGVGQPGGTFVEQRVREGGEEEGVGAGPDRPVLVRDVCGAGPPRVDDDEPAAK